MSSILSNPMSKAIYQPSGKAREYSPWACNLFVGCSNDCTYCFNKRGVLGTVMGGREPRLKSCFKDSHEAFNTFLRELQKHRERIRHDGGLLFSFSTDPCLPETIDLTMMCVAVATGMKVPCLILTKCTDWLREEEHWMDCLALPKDHLAVGFTLTGRDDLEPGAPPNAERIREMEKLHGKGIKTFASIEPVIGFGESLDLIRKAEPYCDHFKAGLLSGDRDAYSASRMPEDLESFVYEVDDLLTLKGKTVYWKESVRNALGYAPADPCCVNASYNMINR